MKRMPSITRLTGSDARKVLRLLLFVVVFNPLASASSQDYFHVLAATAGSGFQETDRDQPDTDFEALYSEYPLTLEQPLPGPLQERHSAAVTRPTWGSAQARSPPTPKKY